MEFPNLGENCSVISCKELDFLPFHCEYCQKIFCKLHFNAHNHECTAAKEVTSDTEKNIVTTFYCASDDCEEGSPVKMMCGICQKHFCLRHRYHGCYEKSEETLSEDLKQWHAKRNECIKAEMKVQEVVAENIAKAKLKPRLSATASKVQLMKLKGKAVGESNIPTTDRVYFMVYLPLSSDVKAKAVFVSKSWTVGRVIDSIASLCNVKNQNNILHSKKLRLFGHTDGHQICSEMDVKLSILINENIHDGASLILEYVEDVEHVNIASLDNLVDYKL